MLLAQGPDQIILVDAGNPDTSYGANPDMRVQLSPNASAIFVFGFDAADAGKQCALVFDLPAPEQGRSPYYSLTGQGAVRFAVLDGPGEWMDGGTGTGKGKGKGKGGSTTYNTRPKVAMPLEKAVLVPGVGIEPLSFPCPGVEAEVAFEMSDEPGSDTCLEYRQDWPGVLVGLYVVKC